MSQYKVSLRKSSASANVINTFKVWLEAEAPERVLRWEISKHPPALIQYNYTGKLYSVSAMNWGAGTLSCYLVQTC